jgi:hypothetical protein
VDGEGTDVPAEGIRRSAGGLIDIVLFRDLLDESGAID